MATERKTAKHEIPDKHFENKTRADVSDAAICISFEPEEADTNIEFFETCFGDIEKQQIIISLQVYVEAQGETNMHSFH